MASIGTPLQPVHVDADLLVLDKPAGLLSVPGRGADKQDCLLARALGQWPDALVVHRLDMATSGLMVLARTAAAQRGLSQAFAERRVHKRYVAVVAGHLSPATGHGGGDASSWQRIDLPIAADWARRPLRVIDAVRGKPSLTRWQVLQHDAAADTTRLWLEPLTGRTHQLRVHCQALGHPILGDALYADRKVAARAPRLLLHAQTLGLAHPVSGAALCWSLPAAF